jgi:hypothetical protein
MEARMVLSATMTIPASATFDEGGAAVQMAPNASLTDTNANFLNGNLIVSEGQSNQTGDIMAIRNQGTAAGQIGISGNTVTYGGTNMGTWTGGTNGSPLVVSLNANATAVDTQALMQDIMFSTSDTASTKARDLSWTFTDGSGGSATANETMNVVGLGPTITLQNNSVNATAGGQASLLASGATLSDNSVTNMNGGTLSTTITNNAGVTDVLAVQNGNGITVSGNTVSYSGTAIGTLSGGTSGSPLTISLNSSASVNATQALIQELSFSTSAGASQGPRQIQLKLNDGTNTHSGTANVTVNVQASVGPQLTTPTGSTNVIAGGNATALGSGTTLTDSVQNWNNGTLTVNLPATAQVGDKLSIGNGGGITTNGASVLYNGTAIGTFTGGSNGQALQVLLNSSATTQAVQAMLQNISLQAAGNETMGTMHVSVSLTDGTNSQAATGTLNANIQAAAQSSLSVRSNMTDKSSAATRIDAGASLSGVNAANLNGATLNVQLLGGNNKASLSVMKGSGVRLQGSNVLVNGQVMGTTSGTKHDLTITFNSNATVAGINQVLDALSFRETGGRNGTDTIQMQFTDSTGVQSNMTSTTVHFKRGGGGGGNGGGGGWWNNY